MEQISLFLTEYAGEIAAAFGVFAVILLLVTLHRIRRIEKYIQGIAGNAAKDTCTKEYEIQSPEAGIMQEMDIPGPENSEIQPAEELIDAVLDEVFS